MRLGYYGYFLTRGNQKYQYNILPILKNFAKIKPCSFSKIEIEDLDEEVFFKDLGMNRFMLILTKNGEIIKAIVKAKLNFAPISLKSSAVRRWI